MKCEHCGYDDHGTGSAHVCSAYQHKVVLGAPAQVMSAGRPALADEVWIAAGGKAGDNASPEQIIAAVKALRALADKFAEVMVKNMSPTELRTLVGQLGK